MTEKVAPVTDTYFKFYNDIAEALQRVKNKYVTEENLKDELIFQFNLLASLNAECLAKRNLKGIAENTRVMCEIVSLLQKIK